MSNYKVGWLLWTLMIIVVTTSPWSDFHLYVVPGHLIAWFPFQDARWSKRWAVDVVENTLLFIPFSYLYLRSQIPTHLKGLVRILLVSALLSGTIECVQLFNTSRVSSMTDVVANITGAFLGAWFFLVLREKRSATIRPVSP